MKRTKHGLFVFPPKKTLIWRGHFFYWPILLQYDVKAISRKFFGHEVFSAERSLNQPKARCVCIRSINQSNRFISVRLLFLFFVRAFSFQGHTKIALTSPRRADEPEGSELERRKCSIKNLFILILPLLLSFTHL